MSWIRGNLLNRIVGFFVFLLLSAVEPSAAEPALRIDKFVFSGGGGSSTNTRFGVTGTIGQKEGDKELSGGRFTVKPGFWSTIGLVQLPGSPLLELHRVGADVVIRWPATSAAQGFVLEQSNFVGPSAVWIAVPASGDNVGAFLQLNVVPQAGARFYRLRRP